MRRCNENCENSSPHPDKSKDWRWCSNYGSLGPERTHCVDHNAKDNFRQSHIKFDPQMICDETCKWCRKYTKEEIRDQGLENILSPFKRWCDLYKTMVNAHVSNATTDKVFSCKDVTGRAKEVRATYGSDDEFYLPD